ncbi:UNVERIFIED_CONTAM: hypothetical protein PYX00_008580 [Menopon gallinae]|uniref:Thioredoxin domain-containing protein n=1 Tax=Menopon gallinae TaxID=328185 RepID=A0AAW2HNX1_9NEOP
MLHVRLKDTMKYSQYLVINFLLFTIIVLLLSSTGNASRVLELTDRFVEIRKEGQWFVMFYAPWCAHCKRLEPIWGHVAQALHRTNIRVGRVDCTRFTAVANEFGVSGFPTLIFIKGDAEFVFKGDRTKEEMVNFALRLSGPPVQRITRSESVSHIKTINELFFVYVGQSQGPVWEAYYEIAEKFQPHGFFYCISHDLIQEHVSVKSEPAIFVYKENTVYFYEGDWKHENFNSSLHDWVNEERFLTFPKVTRGNLHQFYQINKYLVLAVLEENKLEEISSDMLEFRDMVESVVRSNRMRYHKYFQFGWVGSPELANSIAMSVLSLPHLIVVNSTTQHHHFPEDEPSQLTPQALIMFLDQVHNQSAPVFGGNTWWVKLYRLYFEGKTSLTDMWRGNPVLTSVLFGLPLGFLSLICYSICCSDIMDADDDEEEELLHEKRE